MQTSVETPRERDKPKKLLDRMRDVMRQLQRALVQVMTPTAAARRASRS